MVTVVAATASSYYFADPPSQAFDGNVSTPWTTNATSTGWLRAELSTATVLDGYTITSRAGFTGRAPNTWTFEGSNDGSSWTTLDTRSGVTWSSGQARTYSFTNTTAYLYYRVNITANNGDTYLDIAELGLTAAPVLVAGEAFASAVTMLDGVPGAVVAGEAFSVVVAALDGGVVVSAGTDTSNSMRGRRRVGVATVELEVPVAVPPSAITTARVDKAIALPEPELVNGRPT